MNKYTVLTIVFALGLIIGYAFRGDAKARYAEEVCTYNATTPTVFKPDVGTEEQQRQSFARCMIYQLKK